MEIIDLKPASNALQIWIVICIMIFALGNAWNHWKHTIREDALEQRVRQLENAMKSTATIAKMAVEFMQFLDANCGYGADWPIGIVSNEDTAEELIERMNALRDACGITLPDHSHLYERPPVK